MHIVIIQIAHSEFKSNALRLVLIKYRESLGIFTIITKLPIISYSGNFGLVNQLFGENAQYL